MLTRARKMAWPFVSTREDAEDVAVDAVVKVWQARDRIRGSVNAYLHQAVKNVAMDRHRSKAGKLHTFTNTESHLLGVMVEDDYAEVEARMVIGSRIPRDAKEMAGLMAQGFTSAEIAKRLGIGDVACRVRQYRMRKMMEAA